MTNYNCVFFVCEAGSTESDRRDFIGELEIMCMVGSHPNIVSLIGATEYAGKFTSNNSRYL